MITLPLCHTLSGCLYRCSACLLQVTKLDRDPASGTALQEVAFWLNLERALHRIQEKRDSPEVTLTLDILKHGKRFHATVSFDADTGMCLTLFPFYHPSLKHFLLFPSSSGPFSSPKVFTGTMFDLSGLT